MIKVQASKTWLFWTGLLLLGLLLVVLVGSGSEISQALAPPGGVEVGKTVNKDSTMPGEAPVPLYTVTFTNTTGSEVILDTISDTLPAGFLFVDMHPLSDWAQRPDDEEEPVIVWQGPIPVPADGTLSLVYSVDTFGAVPNATPYVNTVEAVTSEGTQLEPASARIWLGEIDLDINKEASPMRVEGGETVEYTVTFANSGHLTGTIETITDQLDPSLSFLGMAAGSDITDPPDQAGQTLTWNGPFEVLPLGSLTLRYTVQAPDTTTWVYPENEVAADASYTTLGPTGVQITVGPPIGKYYIPLAQRDFRLAHLTVGKGVSPETTATTGGEDLIYTVTIENVGDTTGKLASVVDILPTGFSFLGMEAGSDVTAAPNVSGQQLTWNLAPAMQIPPGQQKLVIYRVAHNETEGQYANSVTITGDGTTAQEDPATATVTIERGILLEDDFEAGIDDWTPFLNAYRVAPGQWYWGQNDGYQGSGAATQNCWAVDGKEAHDALLMWLQPGSETWTDYRMEAKLIIRDVDHPQGIWVRGHYQDGSQMEPEDPKGWVTGYYIMVGGGVDSDRHYVSLKQIQIEGDCTTACDNPPNQFDFDNPYELTITKRDGTLARDTWHTLVVEVCGNNIKAWLNGDQYIDHDDTIIPHLDGTVGLKTYKADTVSYDDIIVTPITCNP